MLDNYGEIVRRAALCGCVLVAAIGCNRSGQALEQEQLQEQQRLAEEQRQERQRLAEEQIQEQQRAQKAAVADLAGAAEDLRDERADLMRQQGEMAALLQQACAGIAADQRNVCPVASSRVAGVRNITDGVAVRMLPEAGAAESVERAVNCYHAGVMARTAPSTQEIAGAPQGAGAQAAPANRQDGPMLAQAAGATTCLLDLRGIEIDVDTTGDHVDVELTTDGDRVQELRGHAQRFLNRRLSMR